MKAIMPQAFRAKATPVVLVLAGWLSNTIATAADLRVDVGESRPGTELFVALYDASEKDWGQPLAQQRSPTGDIQFKGLAPGRYAIQLFVDLNGNGELDASSRGFPREPVGFSGNPSLARGRPSPTDCAFELKEPGGTIRIELHQPRRPITQAE